MEAFGAGAGGEGGEGGPGVGFGEVEFVDAGVGDEGLGAGGGRPDFEAFFLVVGGELEGEVAG